MLRHNVAFLLSLLLPTTALLGQTAPTTSSETQPQAPLALTADQNAAFTRAMDKGKECVAKRDFAGAVKAFQEAFQINPGDAGVNFHLGRAALEANDAEAAVMAFERVLMINPGAERAKLELARSYYQLGLMDMAKTYFKEVLDTNPPPEVRRNVERFMTRIDQTQKRHFLSGSLSLGMGWDSNASVAPNDTTIQTAFPLAPVTTVNGADRDIFFPASLSLTHRYKQPDSPWFWKSDATSYNSFYGDLHALDINYFTVGSGPGYERDRLYLEIQPTWEHLHREYDRYLNAYGLQSTAMLTLNPNLYLMASGRIVTKYYYQALPREALNGTVRVGPVLVWGPNRLSARLGWEKENAKADELWEADEQSYTRWSGSLRYDRRLPASFTAFAGYRYQWVDYIAKYATFDKNRTDDVQEFLLGVNRKFWQNYLAELSYTYTKAKSSISLYAYDRQVISLTLSYSF